MPRTSSARPDGPSWPALAPPACRPSAVVLDLPASVVLGRNAGRDGRVVDEAVVRRHLAPPPSVTRHAGGDASETRASARSSSCATPAEVDSPYASVGTLSDDSPERPRPDLDPDPVRDVDIGAGDIECGRLVSRSNEHHRGRHVEERARLDDRHRRRVGRPAGRDGEPGTGRGSRRRRARTSPRPARRLRWRHRVGRSVMRRLPRWRVAESTRSRPRYTRSRRPRVRSRPRASGSRARAGPRPRGRPS